MKHYIVTRHGLKNPDMKYYETRKDLFERYFAASLEAQTNVDFEVLLLCDSQTPQEWKDYTHEIMTQHRVPYRIETNLKRAITEPSIVTRMDNDDAVSNDFVETVQGVANLYRGKPFIVNFCDGYIAHGGEFFKCCMASNMFLTLVGGIDPYEQEHSKMQYCYPSQNIAGCPYWIHIQHSAALTEQRGRNKIFTKKPEGLDASRFSILQS